MQETWQHYIWARNEINIINFFITRKTQKKEHTVPNLQFNFPHESIVKSLKFNSGFASLFPTKLHLQLQLHYNYIFVGGCGEGRGAGAGQGCVLGHDGGCRGVPRHGAGQIRLVIVHNMIWDKTDYLTESVLFVGLLFKILVCFLFSENHSVLQRMDFVGGFFLLYFLVVP
jgi:hypothetical protein